MSAISTVVLCNSDKLGMLLSIQENVPGVTQRLILPEILEHTWTLHNHRGAGTNLLGYHCGVTVLAYLLSLLHDPNATNSVTAARKAVPESAEKASIDQSSSNPRASFPLPVKSIGSILDL